MNGEIPSVPITTLAGVSSLTDLLPEMPLPSPLPQTLSNKSLLFHPRVAEEAQILLSHPNELLIPQLVHSLVQTTSEHIELKDQYAGSEQLIEHQSGAPELLKAILLKNPSAFKGPGRNQQWKLQLPQPGGHSINSTFNQTSPASYGQGSPGYTRHTPQGSPAQPASARLIVPEDKIRPPQSLPNTGFQDPNLVPQRASVIADPQSRIPDLNRPFQDLCENKLNRIELTTQSGSEWDDKTVRRLKLHSEHLFDNVDQNQTVGLPAEYNRPDIHPSHRNAEGAVSNAAGTNLVSGPASLDQINSMRNFRPQKSQGQIQSTPESYTNSLDLPSSLNSGVSPAQASVAPEGSKAGLQKLNKKDSALFDGSGTSASVQKDPSNSESEYTPKSDTSSGVSSGGSSSVVTLGSNDSLFYATPGFEVAEKLLVPVLNFRYGEIEYNSANVTNPGVKAENESYDINKFKKKMLQRNSSANNGGGEPLPESVISGKVKGSEYNLTASEMQKNLKGSKSIIESDSFGAQKSAFQIKPIFVRINRLSENDEISTQKTLTQFEQQQPFLANKLCIMTQNHRKTKTSIIESDSEEYSKKTVSRIFKSRDREKTRESKRKQDSANLPASFHDTDDRSRKRRRSTANHEEIREPSPVDLPKPKVRKVERKMVPVLEKLSVEELMETNTYQRFNTTIDRIFENTDDLDLTIELDDSEDVPPEALIPKYQLQDLCAEAAKLKTLGAMESIPATRLVKLLNILEKNIRDGARVSPIADPDDDEDESKLWLELAMERVMRAMDASLTAIYILTSPNMPKRIYLEDVIDRIVLFTKFQLSNTIYPSFDPVYRINKKGKDGFSGSARKKRSQGHQVREKSILTLYTKLHGLVGLLAELLNIQVLTDTAVLHASSMAVSPFFVEEVSELQLSALKLVTTIFTKYEKHRRLLLDDILASIARLPSSKRSLRTYRLNSEEHIQMLTALVLQLIQCVVILPENFNKSKNKETKEKDKEGEAAAAKDKINMDRDVQIIGKYETAMKIAGNFLSVFLSKCGSKSEEIDYRPLFENFVQDLLTTVNKPEWPATEVLLSLLGKLLVGNFMNKSTDMALRVASLDYLGVVAARLRKDYVTSHRKLASIDQMISEIKAAESKDVEEKNNKKTEDMDPEEERTQFLQRVLLDYLAVNGQSDAAWTYARHFYLAQWYHDCMTTKSKQNHTPNKSNKRGRRKKRKSESSEEEISEPSDQDDDDELVMSEANTTARFQIMEARKQFLLSKIKPFSDESGRTNILQTYIDYNSADLISRYLASKRPFALSFDGYLKQNVTPFFVLAPALIQHDFTQYGIFQGPNYRVILRVLAETSIAIRTKAIKCLTMVVEADPSVLGMKSMQMGVRVSFLDHATSVREAAVDLVGKFVLSRPELIDKYYDMLSARILDTGVSVRKRVIKILRDICIECPEFPKIPEICVKMIRRVNDEEGIKKLVMEVFQNMWFTPVKDRPQLDHKALLRKVMNITEVVATSSKDMGLEWFEQLLLSLFKPKEDKEDSTKINVEPPKALITACTQIVNCLIENVLKLEEQETGKESHGSSQRLVACLTTIYLFAKIRPQLLVNHAITLQPYLSLKCQTQGDYQIVSNVARTLELIVPLMEHPSETFLAQLEEDSVKLILQHDRIVVASCLSCLGSVVNNVTRNFKLIRDCFQKYYGYLIKVRELMEKEISKAQLEQIRPYCKRALFTVGLLMRHFDFTDKDVRDGLPEDLKDQVFSTLFFFVHDPSPDIQNYTMKAIGSLCIRHYEFMLGKELKQLYYKLLTESDAPLAMKAQVLHNIEMYLQEEETRMIKQDQEWAKLSKQENLKEMGDVSSGMASTVIQLYIKEILDAFLHYDVNVRRAALKVIQLILQQGLVHPVQIVPYLICMSTDVEKVVSHSADKQLQEIEKKYPGFIHMKAQLGIRLSYRLQSIIQGKEIVRGFRAVEGEFPGALNGFLYSILRTTKQQRRAIALSVLKQFDEQVKTSLGQMLYLADNLAYFPYQVQDEPLFIVHHIDVMISMSGTNLLQSFREALIPPANQTTRVDPNTGAVEVVYDEDEDEDEDALLNRVPEDTTVLQECITASQGCLLLLVLKQHLKDLYGLTDAKIAQYSPSESAKIYEKAVNRKSNSSFNPKATLIKLKEGTPPRHLDESQRKALIDQYLDFKQLMLKFDPDEEDDDGAPQSTPQKENSSSGQDITPTKAGYNGPAATPGSQDSLSSSVNVTPNPAERGNFPYTQQDTRDLTPGKVPKLTIVTPRPPEKDSLRSHRHKSHKSEKQKKHRHKKRKKYSDDESDDNEFSDPDFLV